MTQPELNVQKTHMTVLYCLNVQKKRAKLARLIVRHSQSCYCLHHTSCISVCLSWKVQLSIPVIVQTLGVFFFFCQHCSDTTVFSKSTMNYF